jgi:hypothetical protein
MKHVESGGALPFNEVTDTAVGPVPRVLPRPRALHTVITANTSRLCIRMGTQNTANLQLISLWG